MATEQKAAPATTAAGSAEEGMLAHLSKMAWQALPAIASAISFVGFVAVVGAAIEWVRFDAAHLPATQAMLALPRQELVAVGALALGTFVVGAVIAVLLVYLLDDKGNASPPTARGLVAVAVVEMAVTLFFIGHHPVSTYVGLGVWLIVIGLVASFVVSSVMRNFMSRTSLKRAGAAVIKAREGLNAAQDAQAGTVSVAEVAVVELAAQLAAERARAMAAALAAKRVYERSVREWISRADQVIEDRDPGLVNEMATAKHKLEEGCAELLDVVELSLILDEAEHAAGHAFVAVRDHLYAWLRCAGKKVHVSNLPGLALLTISSSLALLAVCVIVRGAVCLAEDSGTSWLLILLIVAAVLAMMNLFAARATEKFVWYGVSVFFSVLIFGAGLEIARVLAKPSVQPVALVRKNDGFGVCGVFVTQTNDRIYVGRLPLMVPAKPSEPKGPKVQTRPGILFWVPTADVELVYVGKRVDVDPALHTRAARLLERLYRDRAEAAPITKEVTAKKTNTKKGAPGGASSSKVTPSCTRPP